MSGCSYRKHTPDRETLCCAQITVTAKPQKQGCEGHMNQGKIFTISVLPSDLTQINVSPYCPSVLAGSIEIITWCLFLSLIEILREMISDLTPIWLSAPAMDQTLEYYTYLLITLGYYLKMPTRLILGNTGTWTADYIKWRPTPPIPPSNSFCTSEPNTQFAAAVLYARQAMTQDTFFSPIALLNWNGLFHSGQLVLYCAISAVFNIITILHCTRWSQQNLR